MENFEDEVLDVLIERLENAVEECRKAKDADPFDKDVFIEKMNQMTEAAIRFWTVAYPGVGLTDDVKAIMNEIIEEMNKRAASN